MRRLRLQDESLGVSAPRLSVLSVLVLAGPKRIGELARIEQVEPPTISRLVDALARDGLAVREPDPGDARAVVVRATPEGRRILERGRARRLESLEATLRGLSERELRTLRGGVDILERILREG